MSGTKVGLCFLSLGVRSKWRPSESALLLLPSSSPGQHLSLPSLEGTFSLLVSAASGEILFLDKKYLRRREPVFIHTHSFCNRYQPDIGRNTSGNRKTRSSSNIIHLYLRNCLVCLLNLFIFYLLPTGLLTCSDVTRCASLIRMSAINQTGANLRQHGLDSSHHDSSCYDCPVSLWTRLHGGKLRLLKHQQSQSCTNMSRFYMDYLQPCVGWVRRELECLKYCRCKSIISSNVKCCRLLLRWRIRPFGVAPENSCMLVPTAPWRRCAQRTWFFPCVSAAPPVAPSSAAASVLRSHSYSRPVPVGVGSAGTQLNFDLWWGLHWRGAAPPLNLSSCSATLPS